MAVTPVGPFCPFRSQAANSLDLPMQQLNEQGPEFATEMAKLQLELQFGNEPDPDRLLSTADKLETAVDDWQALITRLADSDDFQTLEYSKLTQAHLVNAGNMTSSDMASMMKWQAQCMRSMARRVPPPMPPSSIDMERMMKMMQEQQQQQSSSGPTSGAPSLVGMTMSAQQITAAPFTGTEQAFESDTVKSEYARLCEDHQQLIDFGSRYASFDPVGKTMYLDQVAAIEDRWNVFFARFSLMGQLNKAYVEQCDAFLNSMGMTEEQYKELLQECHDLMRQDAENERSKFGL